MNTIWAKTDFNSIGIVGSTAYGIVSKLQSVIWVVGGTIRTVLTVIVGQFIGEEKSLIANVVEIVLIVAINKIFTIPMIAIAIGITVWYVTYSIIGSIYYYSNKWKERQNLIALVKYTYLQVKRIQAKQVNGKSEDIDLITNLQDIIPEIEMIKGIIPLDKTAMVG